MIFSQLWINLAIEVILHMVVLSPHIVKIGLIISLHLPKYWMQLEVGNLLVIFSNYPTSVILYM